MSFWVTSVGAAASRGGELRAAGQGCLCQAPLLDALGHRSQARSSPGAGRAGPLRFPRAAVDPRQSRPRAGLQESGTVTPPGAVKPPPWVSCSPAGCPLFREDLPVSLPCPLASPASSREALLGPHSLLSHTLPPPPRPATCPSPVSGSLRSQLCAEGGRPQCGQGLEGTQAFRMVRGGSARDAPGTARLCPVPPGLAVCIRRWKETAQERV